MITSFALSLVGTFATEDSIWDTWNGIISDTFGDNSWIDTDGDSFTDFVWDQVDFGDATASSTSSLFEGWLTGIDFNDFLSETNTKLQEMLEEAGDTTGMDTSEIVDAINDAEWDPTLYGWDENTDLETMLDEMSTMVTSMEVLSWMEGWDLSGEFPALEDMEQTLEDFGFYDLYGLDDISEFLDTTVEDSLPDSYTDYQADLDAIEAELTAILNGDSDAPSMDDVLSDLATLIDSMQADVDGGATDLQDTLEELESVYEVLSYFGYEPTDMLLLLAEDLDSLFADTDFDFDGLDETLGEDWLSEFETAMKELSGSNDYEVCNTDTVTTTISEEYNNPVAFAASCVWLYAGQAPSCTCLDGTGIYGNEDKEAVQESLMCLWSEDDDLTVEQTLRECNGEDVEVDMTMDAFELLDELASALTLDNFVDLDTDVVDSSALSEQFEEIMSAIEDLSNMEINTDGTDGDYVDSVQSWIDKMETLVDDLDVDGSYTEQSKEINDFLDESFTQLQNEMENEEPQSPSKADDGVELWIWILVAVAAFFVIFLVCGCTVYQRNKKLARLAIGIESESYAQVEGGEAPLVPAGGATVARSTGTTVGGEM